MHSISYFIFFNGVVFKNNRVAVIGLCHSGNSLTTIILLKYYLSCFKTWIACKFLFTYHSIKRYNEVSSIDDKELADLILTVWQQSSKQSRSKLQEILSLTRKECLCKWIWVEIWLKWRSNKVLDGVTEDILLTQMKAMRVKRSWMLLKWYVRNKSTSYLLTRKKNNIEETLKSKNHMQGWRCSSPSSVWPLYFISDGLATSLILWSNWSASSDKLYQNTVLDNIRKYLLQTLFQGGHPARLHRRPRSYLSGIGLGAIISTLSNVKTAPLVPILIFWNTKFSRF